VSSCSHYGAERFLDVPSGSVEVSSDIPPQTLPQDLGGQRSGKVAEYHVLQ